MYRTVITAKSDEAFLLLVRKLDGDLNDSNGSMQDTYNQWNNLEHIKEVVLIYNDSEAIACGTYKELIPGNAEMKRIFVDEAYRGKGLGKMVVQELECIIQANGYDTIWLETGKKQTAAIGMYQSLGYTITNNYGQYADMENSVCMKKCLQMAFPEPVTKLPLADIPLDGIKAHLLQGENQQLIFMKFEKEVELAEHSHAGQYGIVLEGQIKLTINGFTATYSKGDRYYIPEGVAHSGQIYAGYSDITFFDQIDRYKIKE